MDQSRIPAAQGFKSQHWLKYQPTNVLDLTILFPIYIYMGYMTVYVCAYVYCITQPRALSRGQDQDRVR